MLAAAVFSGFAAALAAPWLYRGARGGTGWILAVLPLGLAAYFLWAMAGEGLSVTSEWAPSAGLALSFRVDGLGGLFALLITGVGALILIYSGGYMQGKPEAGRFFAFLLLFMASMLGLVLADNVLLLYIFWELTTISSWLLIGFEHEKEQARRAAWQALVITVGGGLSLLAGAVLLAMAAGTWELSEILLRGEAIRASGVYVPVLLLILGAAFTKSAHVPFHIWLPNAMAAPTPVSAYLHSATMVKAGVYLLARLNPALGGTELWVGLVAGFGAATMLTGAWLAILQTELKRVLAYSTIAALGTMSMLLGLGGEGAVRAALVLLFGHAFYKGTLFMVAGAVDHEAGAGDALQAKGLRRVMPITAAAALLALVSMAGIPPSLGFIGEELLFESTLKAGGAAWLALALTGAALVAWTLYAAAGAIVAIAPFFGKRVKAPKQPHEAPASIWLGPVLLGVGGIILALSPGMLGDRLIRPAVSAALGRPSEVELHLWHGLTPSLLLDGITIAGAAAIFAFWHPIRRSIRRLAFVARFGPERAYALGLEGLQRLALFQTGLLQSGYLPHYVLIVLVTVIAVAGYPLLTGGGLELATDLAGIRAYDLGLAVLIMLAALTAVLSSSRVAVVAAMGAVGFGVAVVFALFGGPDPAIAQFLVETLFVILLVMVLPHLPRFGRIESRAAAARNALVALAAGSLVTILLLAVTVDRPDPALPRYFAEKSQPEGRGRNIVNVILVDFRSLDTLGEITVLGVASVGVSVLLKFRAGRR